MKVKCINKLTYIQIDKDIVRQTYRQIKIQLQTEIQTDKDTVKQMKRYTDRERYRQIDKR